MEGHVHHKTREQTCFFLQEQVRIATSLLERLNEAAPAVVCVKRLPVQTVIRLTETMASRGVGSLILQAHSQTDH